MTERIVFIYNVNHSKLADIRGAMTIALAPGNYECDLRKITHDFFNPKPEWNTYTDSLRQEKLFLYKNQLVGEYEKYRNYILPTILLENENKTIELVSKKDLKSIHSIQQLAIAIDKQLI